MEIVTHQIDKPAEMNIILGMSHFIRTVEDLHEALVTSCPGVKFGLAFCEASGPCLVRSSGTDPELAQLAARNLLALGAGHVFLIMLGRGDVFPVHVLRAIKQVPELVSLFCATGNPVQVVLARSEQGSGVLGVIDGLAPAGIEGEADVRQRQDFLRAIGLKL